VLHLKGLGVYISKRSSFSCDEPGLRMLCWGADLTAEKRRQAALQAGRTGRLRASRTHVRNGVEICAERSEESGREAAAIGKNPHSYPEGRVPNVTQEVKEFGHSWLASDLVVNLALSLANQLIVRQPIFDRAFVVILS